MLWIGAGIAALVAIAAISWGLYDWNHTVKVQKLAEANRLRDQAELLIATGRLKEAEAQSGELDAFAAGSPWPEMRQMSDQVRRALIEKKRAILAAGPAGVFPSFPSPGTPGEASGNSDRPRAGQGGGSPDRLASANPPPEYREREKNLPNPAPLAKGSSSVAAAPKPPEELNPTFTPPPGAETRLDSSEGPYAASPATRPSAPAAVVQHTERPPIRKLTPPAREPTDEQIGAAITRGVDIMLDEFDPTTHLMPGAEQRDAITRGEDILSVYALMQCQEATEDPRLNPHEKLMKGLIDAMKGLDLNHYNYETYARGLRATALALYNRPEDRGVLSADAMTLVRGTHSGGYSYQLDHSRGGYRSSSFEDNVWDNSNSQYGLLGVWSAAEVAYEVPESYWAKVQGHWTKAQNHDGTWAYYSGGGSGTHSMTCAGLASMFVTHDYLDAPKFGTVVGRDPFTPPLARGLQWLETGDNSISLAAFAHRGYDFYGLERVGLASGFKFFGAHEWYRELAATTLQEQQPNGSWGNQVVETAYRLLFLARGRHPILMNKLRFDGNWANRPRDAANLARFVGHQLERPLNWQV
ncbi:MAG TPA: hypothetical protein VGI81_19135, partial [Tepidisphaeraceae bacterium]